MIFPIQPPLPYQPLIPSAQPFVRGHGSLDMTPAHQSGATKPSTRFAVMILIFCVSLFGVLLCFPIRISLTLNAAVSFPAVSKRLRFLRIPPIFFFVGKHFGTGDFYTILHLPRINVFNSIDKALSFRRHLSIYYKMPLNASRIPMSNGIQVSAIGQALSCEYDPSSVFSVHSRSNIDSAPCL